MFAASNCMQAPKYLETTMSWDQKSVIDKFLEIFLKYVNITPVWNLVGCRFYSCRTLITLWGSQVLPFLIKNVDLLLHRDSTFTTWRRGRAELPLCLKNVKFTTCPKTRRDCNTFSVGDSSMQQQQYVAYFVNLLLHLRETLNLYIVYDIYRYSVHGWFFFIEKNNNNKKTLRVGLTCDG